MNIHLPYISMISLTIWIIFFFVSGLLMFLFFGEKLNWSDSDFSNDLSNLRNAVLILLFVIFIATFVFCS